MTTKPTTMPTLTPAQRYYLRALARNPSVRGRCFSRVLGSLRSKGLVQDAPVGYALTDSGRAVLIQQTPVPAPSPQRGRASPS